MQLKNKEKKHRQLREQNREQPLLQFIQTREW